MVVPGNCIFDDSSAVSSTIEIVDFLPANYNSDMTCQQFLDYVTYNIKFSAYYMCQLSTFSKQCCQACKSNRTLKLKRACEENDQFDLFGQFVL